MNVAPIRAGFRGSSSEAAATTDEFSSSRTSL